MRTYGFQFIFKSEDGILYAPLQKMSELYCSHENVLLRLNRPLDAHSCIMVVSDHGERSGADIPLGTYVTGAIQSK